MRSRVVLIIYFLGCALLRGADSEVDSLRRKADGGDAEAQFSLALMYDLGVDVPKNYAESGKWYLKAAEQGLAEAQFKLGVRYFEYGKTARENYTSAFTWFYKAANQGVTEAQFNVALMYQLGRGVPTNKVEAYKWFNIASAQGFTKATAARDILGGELSRIQVVEAEKRASAFAPKRQFKSQRIVATDGATPKTSGTGFFITSDGYLVTNYHVVEDAENLSIKTRKGLLPATLIKSDITNDLALLKVSGAFHPLPLSRMAAAQLGQSVFTIGFPNPDMQGLEPKLTRGEISSLAGMKDDPRHFQISVPVQPGNSGGPLVDLNGNVVGVVSMRMGDLRALKYTGALPQNVNYAIKTSVLSNLVSNIPDAQRALRAGTTDPAKFEDIVQHVEDAVALILGY